MYSFCLSVGLLWNTNCILKVVWSSYCKDYKLTNHFQLAYQLLKYWHNKIKLDLLIFNITLLEGKHCKIKIYSQYKNMTCTVIVSLKVYINIKVYNNISLNVLLQMYQHENILVTSWLHFWLILIMFLNIWLKAFVCIL